MASAEKTKPDHKTGVGFYPEFPALWHLHALGVVDDLVNFYSKDWEAAEKSALENGPIRIVVMDTTVDWEHPNLRGVINIQKMRDFSSLNGGEVLVGISKGRATIPRPTGATVYGAHGTAVAGLIGARPTKVMLQPPDQESLQKDKLREVILPYVGINPFCEIIPVSLTAAPDPDMVHGALAYAASLQPQIIVVAAAWDDTDRAIQDAQSFGKHEGKWSHVNALLSDVCKNSLVLCAAGNSGPGQMAYPACLTGQIPGLIAVTACDIKGEALTYAFDPKGKPGVIRTLSNQGPSYDRSKVLLDPWAAVDPYLKRPAGNADFPVQRIISLDPRGPGGYNPSPYRYTPPSDGPYLEIGSLYAEFSGTSAATAIAAGLISLAMQAKNATDMKKMKGEEMPSTATVFDLQAALRLF